MRQKSGTSKAAADKLVRGIKRKTRKHYSAEEKIRIVLAGLRGEESIAVLCRREGIAESLYYSWSKEFLEAGKGRLAGDTARQATTPEGKEYYQGFVMYDFQDGSSILAKVDASGEARDKKIGTIIFLSGTKRFEGITGRGTISSWMPTPWDMYTEIDASFSVSQD